MFQKSYVHNHFKKVSIGFQKPKINFNLYTVPINLSNVKAAKVYCCLLGRLVAGQEMNLRPDVELGHGVEDACHGPVGLLLYII